MNIPNFIEDILSNRLLAEHIFHFVSPRDVLILECASECIKPLTSDYWHIRAIKERWNFVWFDSNESWKSRCRLGGALHRYVKIPKDDKVYECFKQFGLCFPDVGAYFWYDLSVLGLTKGINEVFDQRIIRIKNEAKTAGELLLQGLLYTTDLSLHSFDILATKKLFLKIKVSMAAAIHLKASCASSLLNEVVLNRFGDDILYDEEIVLLAAMASKEYRDFRGLDQLIGKYGHHKTYHRMYRKGILEPPVLAFMGFYHLQKKEFKDSIRCFVQAIEGYGNVVSASVWVNLCHAYFAMGDWKNAADTAGKAIEACEKEQISVPYEVWIHLGQSYFMLGEWKKTADASKKVLEIYQERFLLPREFWENAGEANMKMGHWQTADQCYSNCYFYSDTSSDILANMIRVKFELGEWSDIGYYAEKAIKVYKQEQRVVPVEVWKNKIKACSKCETKSYKYQLKKEESSYECFAEAITYYIEEQSDSGDVWGTLAGVGVELRRWCDVKKCLKKAFASYEKYQQPISGDVFLANALLDSELGNYLLSQESFENAFKTYERKHQNVPAYVLAVAGIVTSYIDMKKAAYLLSRAIEGYEKEQQRVPLDLLIFAAEAHFDLDKEKTEYYIAKLWTACYEFWLTPYLPNFNEEDLFIRFNTDLKKDQVARLADLFDQLIRMIGKEIVPSRLLFYAGYINFQKEHWSQCDEYFDQGMKNAEKQQQPIPRWVWIYLARANGRLKERYDQKRNLKNAALAFEKEQLIAPADIWFNLRNAYVSSFRDDQLKAAKYSDKEIAAYLRYQKKGQSESFIFGSKIHLSLSHFEVAADRLTQAIEIMQQELIDDAAWQKVADYVEKFIEIAEEKNQALLPQLLANVGKVNFKLGNRRTALRFYENAQKAFIKEQKPVPSSLLNDIAQLKQGNTCTIL